MKYYKVNGKLKAIPSGTPQEKIDAWVEANNATFYKEVEDEKPQEEGKTEDDATTGADATSTTPAPNQGTDQSNNQANTESTSGESSSASQLVRKKSPRTGVRKNYDEEGNVTGESTHLMRRELIDGKWTVFPSLFQEEDGSWKDMSNEDGWYKIHQEAKKRGEVYEFDSEEEAVNFADKGSWKEGFFQEEPSSDSPSFDWLNYQQNDGSISTKPFFNQSEEQAVAQLRAKYTGFKFEESNIFEGPKFGERKDGSTVMTQAARGGFNAIKMTSPDGKNSKKILLKGNFFDDMSDSEYERSYND